jgi:hypothetical protein
MDGLFSRHPSLRLVARAITLALIAFPLVAIATAIGLDITHTSETATIAIIVAFGLLLATTIVLVKSLFRTIPFP